MKNEVTIKLLKNVGTKDYSEIYMTTDAEQNIDVCYVEWDLRQRHNDINIYVYRHDFYEDFKLSSNPTNDRNWINIGGINFTFIEVQNDDNQKKLECDWAKYRKDIVECLTDINIRRGEKYPYRVIIRAHYDNSLRSTTVYYDRIINLTDRQLEGEFSWQLLKISASDKQMLLNADTEHLSISVYELRDNVSYQNRLAGWNLRNTELDHMRREFLFSENANEQITV